MHEEDFTKVILNQSQGDQKKREGVPPPSRLKV
jgi:hypothetical protein